MAVASFSVAPVEAMRMALGLEVPIATSPSRAFTLKASAAANSASVSTKAIGPTAPP